MSISQIPSGWTITRSDERIVVQHVSGSFYAAAKEGDSGIAESILYMLADSLLSATLSPAHIEDGEEVEVVAWQDPYHPERIITAGQKAYNESRPRAPASVVKPYTLALMTVAQHQRLVAARASKAAAHIEDERGVLLRDMVDYFTEAGLPEDLLERYRSVELAVLSAPPAAGVPEGLKADLYEIAGQILNIAHATHKPVSHTLMAPIRDYTLRDAKSVARVAGERLVGIADRIAAPTPTASEQQRAVVMPEGLREALGKAASSWLYENDPQGLDWCDPRNVDALLDALFEAAPHLATPSQENDR